MNLRPLQKKKTSATGAKEYKFRVVDLPYDDFMSLSADNDNIKPFG